MDLKIIERSNEENKKLYSILKNVLNCSEEEFRYKKTIFMASITYPATNEGGDYDKEIISTVEKRLIYIKKLLSLLKEKN